MGEEKDEFLAMKLQEAMALMSAKGYKINSKVTIKMDNKLGIMGFAEREGDKHVIIVSGWSVESGMLEGLILHELAHIYFIERNSVTHNTGIVNKVIERLSSIEGLRRREVEYLIEAYNHLQNIIVDDIVFEVIDRRMTRIVKSFFQQWVTDKSTGDPVSDAAILCRNAFAIASLKRRGMLNEGDFALTVNKRFLEKLGDSFKRDFEWIENFLEEARADVDERYFTIMLESYFERIIGVMRSAPWIEDLK
jgi:hypothetical protein